MQQLYAKVKRSSKYYAQNQMAKDMGEFPFPVTVQADAPDNWCVKGGPGGQYCLDDVNLFVKSESGKELRVR